MVRYYNVHIDENTLFMLEESKHKALYERLKGVYAKDDDDTDEQAGDSNNLPAPIADDSWRNYRGETYTQEEMDFIDDFNEKFPEPSFDIQKEDIGGLEQVLNQFNTFKAGIEHPQMYEMMGIRPANGFLLQGPPGTGKTYIAKFLANNLSARFVDLPLTMFESKWVGTAPKLLSSYIDMARDYHSIVGQKVLLWFDEAEEAFKDRSLDGWHGPRVNVLLREMDGMGDNRGLIFAGATNHADKIDPALKRAGRFDLIIQMPEYDADMLGQVYLATANRLNRAAPHHNPFRITTDEAHGLGVMAAAKRFLPADISEIFRRAGENHVQRMLETTTGIPDSLLYVRSNSLEQETENYERNTKTKRIGY